MPRARVTSSMSAPVASHRSATMFANDILVARNALAACLTISAVPLSMTMTGESAPGPIRSSNGW